MIEAVRRVSVVRREPLGLNRSWVAVRPKYSQVPVRAPSHGTLHYFVPPGGEGLGLYRALPIADCP